MVICYKHREVANQVSEMRVLGNVRGGDDGQTARGVALVDHRGADTPEELVKHERRAGEEDLFRDGTGQIQAFI